jgi:putative membrane protein
MMGWYHDGMGWGGWLVMVVSMFALWALVVFAVVALFRSSREEREPSTKGRDPLGILDERFARGEIDEDEYTRRRSVLHTADGP